MSNMIFFVKNETVFNLYFHFTFTFYFTFNLSFYSSFNYVFSGSADAPAISNNTLLKTIIFYLCGRRFEQ